MSAWKRPKLSVTIVTLNEEENIGRAIRSVAFADEVIVVDSGSTDRTVEIAQGAGAKVIKNRWPGYGPQKNFAQKQASHDWVLSIDADEEIPPELAQEISGALERASGDEGLKGFYFPRKTFYLGRWIRHGGWYPNYLVRLADRRAASWTEPNVHEELQVNGRVEGLKYALHHFSFPTIQEQVLTNLRFSRLGSEDLQRSGRRFSLWRLLWKPWWKFMDSYFVRAGFLDGLPGFIIAVNAAHSMFLKHAYLVEPKILGTKQAANKESATT